MRYRLELILGPDMSRDVFEQFVQALREVSVAGRLSAGVVRVNQWQQEPRAGGAVVWWNEYDSSTWAEEGTPMLLALLALAAQPYATPWQLIGQAAIHPDVGLRLLQLHPGQGMIELYRLP